MCVQTFCLLGLPVGPDLNRQSVSNLTDTDTLCTHRYTKNDGNLIAIKMTDAYSPWVFVSLNRTLNHFNRYIKCREFFLMSVVQRHTLLTSTIGTLYVLTDLV